MLSFTLPRCELVSLVKPLQREFLLQNLEHIPPLIYTLLSCWTRFYKIGKSDVVVWDEAHFGKFGTYYLKREFYFDVHPPLGKIIVGLAGLLSGYDGSFDFKSGEKYPENVPYVAMRVIMALFGVAMVPLGWFTAVELGMSLWACHLVALMVLCGARYIFFRLHLAELMPGHDRRCMVVHISVHPARFDAFVLYLHDGLFHDKVPQPTTPVRVHRPPKTFILTIPRSFTFEWWFWLAMTGFSIGCVSR